MEAKIQTKHKARIFETIFSDKKEALALYNAINHTTYQDKDDLQITTLEDAIYMSMKNDISFIVSSTLNLYEHQSSYNPNMPLRGLSYFARLYEQYVKTNGLDIYSSTLLKLPRPQFIVFYNGEKELPDQDILRLSDAFTLPEFPEGDLPPNHLEVIAVMLNINAGRNEELLEKCQTLKEYALLIGKIRYYKKLGYTAQKAVEMSVDECIAHDILKNFLIKNKAGVVSMFLFEYDEKLHEETLRREGQEEGIKEGIKLGQEEGLKLGRSQGIKLGQEEGLKLGQERGKHAEKLRIAQNLLDVLEDDVISEKTGLPVETIQKLRKSDC